MQEQSILDTLLLRLDSANQDFQLVTAQEIEDWPEGLLTTLCHEGLLAPTTPSDVYTCTRCDEDHTEEVMVVESPPGSEPRLYIPCPQFGRVPVKQEELRQWRLSVEGLVKISGRLLGLPGPFQEVIPDRAWRIGVGNLGGVNRDFLMLRGLSWDDGKTIQGRFLDGAASVSSVFILPREIPCSPGCSLPLSRVLRLVDGKILFDKEVLDLIVAGWAAMIPATTMQDSEKFEHSDDYRWVRWHDHEFLFSKRRAKVIRMLHDAYHAGNPVLSWDQIKARLETYPQSMFDIFKDSQAWNNFVIEVSQGQYRLNLKQ